MGYIMLLIMNSIVTNEQLCFLTAKKLGIEIPDSFIINTGDAKEEEVLFATKRYDRFLMDNGHMLDGLRVPYTAVSLNQSSERAVKTMEYYGV